MRVLTSTPSRNAAVLLALALVQGIAIQYTLNHYGAWLATAALAISALVLLAVPRALSRALASVARLGRRLVWWHGLWLLLFLSDLVFRIRDLKTVQDAPLDFWAAYRIALIATAAFLLIARLSIGRGYWLRSLCSGLPGVLAFYAVVCVVSAFWSVYPQWTLYKSLEYLVDVAVLAAVVTAAGTSERYKTLLDWTWILMALLLASVWAGAVIWPDKAWTHDPGMTGKQLEGVLPQISGNGVGELAAVLAVVSLSRLAGRSGVRSRPAFYGLTFAASAFTLTLSQTRSALIAFAFGAALVLLLSRRIAVATFLVIAAALVLSQTSFADAFWTYFRRGQDRQQFSSLSGRAEWWASAWNSFLERPLMGFGAYAGGRFVALANVSERTASSLHSTWLEILLGTGVVGVLPVLAALIGAWHFLLRPLRYVSRSLDRQLALEAVGVLAVVTVRSIFTVHLIWHPSLAFLVALGYAELLRRGRKTHRCAANFQPARFSVSR